MKLTVKDQQTLDDYKIELEAKKKYSEAEINDLIAMIKYDAFHAYRKLIESQLLKAYEIALIYNHEELTPLDFIHAANEGLEVAVTSNEYNDYKSFVRKVEEGIKSSIDLMLSFLAN